jgi:hypothetical protein
MSRFKKGAAGWLIAVACLVVVLSASVALADAVPQDVSVVQPSSLASKGQSNTSSFKSLNS